MKTLSDILWNGDELVNPQEEGLTEIQFIPINCAAPMGFLLRQRQWRRRRSEYCRIV